VTGIDRAAAAVQVDEPSDSYKVGHALESTFIPLEMYFLHRNYLVSNRTIA
jgi:hypothetical protein